MLVRELIAILQELPQDVPVQINDEDYSVLFEEIDREDVFLYTGTDQPGDETAVIISISG